MSELVNTLPSEYQFRMEIGLNEPYTTRLFKLHKVCGGSNIALNEVIEFALRRGIDELLNDNKEVKSDRTKDVRKVR